MPHPACRAGLRDASQAGTTDQAMLGAEADRLAARLDELVAGATRYLPNRRLLNHLASEREHLFTFLRLPGVQATNWRAGQAIRPAVVTRKSWGGNRTWAGAETWQVLASVLRTATQQARDPVELLTCLLRAPSPMVATLTIPGADKVLSDTRHEHGPTFTVTVNCRSSRCPGLPWATTP